MPREDDGMGAPLPIAPLACIPTTAGTGSEVSMGAVIKDPERKVKLEIADFPLFPRLAILDPESTRTLPPKVAAATGMDATTHAIEGYVSVDWSPHQDARSLQALRLIRDNLERAVETPEDEEARGNMLVAANLAITISLGSTHAMSHPCGAHFGVPHGVANAINLPHIVRFNAEGGPDIADRYRDINELFGLESGGSDEAVGDALATHITELVGRLGLPDPAVRGRRARGGHPAPRRGRDGRRHHAAEPARGGRRGLRGAVQAGSLRSRDPARRAGRWICVGRRYTSGTRLRSAVSLRWRSTARSMSSAVSARNSQVSISGTSQLGQRPISAAMPRPTQ